MAAPLVDAGAARTGASPPGPRSAAADEPRAETRSGVGPGPRGGLATRIALVTTAVAALAVLLAGVVSLQLVRQAGTSQARQSLEELARVVAGTIDAAPAAPRADVVPQARLRTLGRVTQQLEKQGITVAVASADGREARSSGRSRLLTPADLAGLNAGQPVHAQREIDGRGYFLEAQPLEGGGGVALLQRTSVTSTLTESVRRRTLVALFVGLSGAALVGLLLARRLARPLKHAAEAAHRMAAGARDVRVEPEGPVEVAEVAESLNRLAAALQTSEGRQREFLLSVSHELRTPLTAVKGFAEALADGVTAGDDVRPTGAVMLAEATRLERLVSDLLDLARLGAQDFRIDLAEVDLTELVRSAAAVWAARCADEGVLFRLAAPDRPLVVRSDATRVRQVLDGLAENALRVTPAGAPIVLALAAEATGADRAVLQIRDGGPGLMPDDLAVAFERSALYDRYRGVRRVGTGVGLALVAGLVARLGGTVQAGQAPEGGACFTVRLPPAGPFPG